MEITIPAGVLGEEFGQPLRLVSQLDEVPPAPLLKALGAEHGADVLRDRAVPAPALGAFRDPVELRRRQPERLTQFSDRTPRLERREHPDQRDTIRPEVLG